MPENGHNQNSLGIIKIVLKNEKQSLLLLFECLLSHNIPKKKKQ